MKPPRIFVCGDIHGCYDELMAGLDRVSFSPDCDHLIALGDLVDRGPKNEQVLALLDEPWFSSIMGNHEVLMLQAEVGNSEMHIINGGGWFATLTPERREELAKKVQSLPYAIEIITPTGRKVGMVHADMPGADWGEFMACLGTPQVQDYAVWSRERVGVAKSGGVLQPITGIDHVYFGHTPLREPLRCANMSWIDTGCFATGRITIEELW